VFSRSDLAIKNPSFRFEGNYRLPVAWVEAVTCTKFVVPLVLSSPFCVLPICPSAARALVGWANFCPQFRLALPLC
jgi:hypothetical protein